MKKSLLFAAAIVLGMLPGLNASAALQDDVRGRILLQVEKNGEAWYSNPETGRLYFLGRPVDALELMRQVGLGISNENLDKLQGEGVHEGPADISLSRSLVGRIVLQVEDKGQAWYINPVDLNRYFLGSPADAFRVLREQGLGISNANLGLLPLSQDYTESTRLLNIAENAVAVELSEGTIWDNAQTEIDAGNLTRLAKDNKFVYKLRLLSPVSSEEYGYLGKGVYYYSSSGLMSEAEYLRSELFVQIEGEQASQKIIGEMLAIQAALQTYRDNVGGYPLSKEAGDLIGIPGRDILTLENGFFGSADESVLHKTELPAVADVSYVYKSADGSSYTLNFSLPVSVEGFAAGSYVLTPSGISAAS